MSTQLQKNILNSSVTGNGESAAAPIEDESSQDSVKLNWYQRLQDTRTQSKSLTAGSLIWTASYMHLVWSIIPLAYNINIKVTNPQSLPFILWFIGAIIGSYLGRFVVDVWSPRVINFVCGILLCIAGTCLIVPHLPYIFSIMEPLIAGGTFSINYISIISHAADNTIKKFRGYILVSVTLIAMLSTAKISATLLSEVYSIRNLNMHFGASTTVLSLLAMFIAPFWTYPSVVYLLRQGNGDEALSSLIKLRQRNCETSAIRNEFDELKLLISEEYSLVDSNSKNIFSNENLRILRLIIGLKMLNVFTSNAVLYLITFGVMIPTVGLLGGLLIILITRIYFLFLPLFLVDKWGRKRFLLISGYGCGISLMTFGVPLLIGFNYIFVPIIIFFIHSFAALGIDSIHNIYSGEAFPLARRTTFLSITSCFEYFLHLIIIILYVSVPASLSLMTKQICLFFWSTSIITLTFWLNRALPETKGMSLRQCRDEFNRKSTITSDSGNTDISFPYIQMI